MSAESADALLDQRRLVAGPAQRRQPAVRGRVLLADPDLSGPGQAVRGLCVCRRHPDPVAGGWSLAQRAVWPLLLGGCVNFAVAAAAYVWPAMTLSEFGILLVVWAIALAAVRTIGCATLREADPDYLLLARRHRRRSVRTGAAVAGRR